ncbi:hypothetical protein GF359_09260 [candidate division WOR-3 bacterium]|uniref:CCA tRNA nucleotidyltransferase n=1 Tax=candidate division WOR-3 bacterium TaxID=2052148 RepID=A0A9D5KAT1_UNCW3|nr:hypothetical protein [candidate division WOR-3 bacterium]MBD3365387.1 hypothetical protein [candidate division WOR-3 bacterium]
MKRKRWDSLLRSSPEALRLIGRIAAEEGVRLYLVGGAVRDKIMGFETADIDLACEGDVAVFAKRLASELDVDFTLHRQFLTAALEGPDSEHIDIARTRRETYPEPGKLPVVKPASITDDLHRRDFAINAIALSLNPSSFGLTIDPLCGEEDIRNRIIRTLHSRSFTDDPTRIFRAVRYSERLGFRIEKNTFRNLKKAVDTIADLTPERLFYELQCISKEKGEVRVKAIKKLETLGALSFLGHPLKPLSPVRLSRIPNDCTCEFLCLVFSHFPDKQISKLPAKKSCLETARTIRQASSILARLSGLLRPSSITRFLSGFDKRGLKIITDIRDSRECEKIMKYRKKYSKVRIHTTGEDLKKMGIPQGPLYRRILDDLVAAKLDGLIENRDQELEFIKQKEY